MKLIIDENAPRTLVEYLGGGINENTLVESE